MRSVPECAASESRPSECVARPATSLTAINTQAATIETRAVRRCGLMAAKDRTATGRAEGPPGGRAFRREAQASALGVRDVAAEALLQERPRACALVEPVAVLQGLVLGCGVLEVEAACLRVREAREGRGRTEEGRDPDVREPTVGRAGCVRVERAAGDLADEVAVELAVHACEDGRAVAALRLARARALARVRQERAAVRAQNCVRAVVVLVHAERALLGVDGPRVAARAAVVRDHVVGPELAVLALEMAVPVAMAGVCSTAGREG